MEKDTVWSKYIQGINTLYLSRSLRFSDAHRENFTSAFQIKDKVKILEIGCGAGALASSLARWYPNTEIIGVDRDAAFIEFAACQIPCVKFVQADATDLPFPDNSLDVTISNTVQEHIETSKFFGEQFRVLKPNGVCIVISTRYSIDLRAAFMEKESDFEREFWSRTEFFGKKTLEKYNVGKYSMNERDLPLTMEKYGFRDISVNYLAINLTPDDPKNSAETAHAMINAERMAALDSLNSLSDIESSDEIARMKQLVNERYDKRVKLYDCGEKQWDTTTLLIMILRGVK